MNRLCFLLISLALAATVSCQWKKVVSKPEPKITQPLQPVVVNDGGKPVNTTTQEDPNEATMDSIFRANEDLVEKGSDFDESSSSTFTIGDGSAPKLFEGDIVMTSKLSNYLDKAKEDPEGKNDKDSKFDALVGGQWPKAIVPYTIQRNFPYTNLVKEAIKEFQKRTCIKFVPRRRERSYVRFVYGVGCFSMIGKTGRSQQISLGRGCGYKGTVLHEIMHALGFFHEQSRLDRDKYIRINWKNIKRSMWYNFEKYKHGQADTLGEPYDLKSIMHYGNYAFAKTRRYKTIIARSNSKMKFGRATQLSEIDVNQLNKYYNCKGYITASKTTTTATKSTKATKEPVITTTKATTVKKTEGCVDKYRPCGMFVKNVANLCKYAWVKNNCKKSCKHESCLPKTQKKTKCFDKNKKSCPGWSKSNKNCRFNKGCCESQRYKKYMKSNCKFSCGYC